MSHVLAILFLSLGLISPVCIVLIHHYFTEWIPYKKWRDTLPKFEIGDRVVCGFQNWPFGHIKSTGIIIERVRYEENRSGWCYYIKWDDNANDYYAHNQPEVRLQLHKTENDILKDMLDV